MKPNESATIPVNNRPDLAIHGGTPIRRAPLPLEFPGVHYMDEEEVEAVVRVVRSRSPFRYYGVDLQGEVDAFEREFAEYLGIEHCLAVNSGTGALHVALSAMGVGPGQEVIVPAYLWVSIAAAVVNLGAIPVLADIDDTFGLDPAPVAARITPRTTVIIVVHMSGAPVNVEAVAKIARERGIFLLEDCAQCAGGSIGGKKVGTFGDMSIFSFQMNKNMTAGEGGCIATRHRHLFDRAVASHDLGYARDASGRNMFECLDLCLWGRGSRLDEVRAAILRVQLRKLPRIVEHMRGSKYRIRKGLEQIQAIKLRRILDPSGDTGCFLLTTFATPEQARAVNQALRAEGIGTFPQGLTNVMMTEWGLHIYYNIPSLVHKTSIDKGRFPWALTENRESRAEYSKGTCPQADSLFERTMLLAIPSNLAISDEEDIVAAFRKVVPVVADCATVKTPGA